MTYLKEALETKPGSEGVIRGYRGGYLPLKRREIERGLREGSVLGVVSTNALELGIDIGSLDAAVLVGYPGSVASAWQQAGRAGRRAGTSVAVLVANSTPLNQFIAKNPDYFFGAPVEQGRINPDNLQILVNHVKCAAFELPFAGDEPLRQGEPRRDPEATSRSEKLLHRAGERWHWTSESYPADAVSLRSVSSDNFVIQDVTARAADRRRGGLRLGARPWSTRRRSTSSRAARTSWRSTTTRSGASTCARRRWTTTPTPSPTRRCASSSASRRSRAANGRRNHGEVHVTSQVVGFKKIKFHTNENVGSGELQHARERDAHDRLLAHGAARDDARRCPTRLEERRDGVVALSYTLGQLAALFLMCDRHDLGVALGDNGQGEARIERGLLRLGAGTGGRRDEPPPGRRLRAERLRLRQLPGRHRPLRAALPPPRPAARREPRADRGLPLRRRLPVVRGARRGGRQPRQGGGAGDPRRGAGAPRIPVDGFRGSVRSEAR